MPVQRGKDPMECLGSATMMHQCEWELPPPTAGDAYNRVTAALMRDVYFADLDGAFCVGAPRCLPVVDGVVVWHDSLHFSAEWVVHQRGEVWDRIRRSGVLRGV